MSETSDGAFGQQQLNTPNDEFNILQFLIKQILGRMNTSTLVQIVAVHAPVGVAPVGFVDVLPLVNQLDGSNQPVPHTTVYNIPYVRIQGGANAIIVDPQVGDIGMCSFAQQDISTVKTSKAKSNPGSKRRFDMADGLYIGGALNQVPTRYVMIDDTGITIEGVAKITMHGNDIAITANTTETTATTMTFNGHVVVNGSIDVSGDVHAAGTVTGDTDVVFAGRAATSHVHTGGTLPTGKTGAPV